MNTSYSISTTDPLPFDIDSSTGDLSVTEDLDYDTGTTSYSFTVICIERDSPDLNDTATVEILLLPVNEFRPQVVGTSNVFVFVPEDTPVGTVIASNSDTAPPGTLSEYTIIDNDAGIDGLLTFTSTDLDTEYFTLELDTGSILLRRELDLDNQTDPTPTNFEAVEVTGCDFFPPIDFCPNLNIRIFVNPVNEFTPQFSQDSYSTSIPEDTPEGAEVLVVECTDDDVGVGQFAGIELYNVSQAVMDAFAIDGSNGNVTVRAVNYVTDRSYEFMVRCLDTGGLEDFAEVTINIDFTPQFSQDSYSTSIPEDTPEGTEVLVVECTDGDVGVGQLSGIELYNASQAVMDAFAIDGSNGNITVRAVNYETDQSYEFMVRCVDTGGLEEFAEVTINIEDINDNSPMCNVPTTLSVTYSSTSLFTLTCSDLDSGQNGQLSYTISSTIPPSGGTFEIDNMGVVTFTGTAEEGTYTITIRVSNPDGLYTEYEITLRLTVVNEFTPQFSQDSYTTSIPEDTPEGTEVLMVECTDGDVGVGQFAGIELYNASRAVMDAFAIDGSNGNITVRAVNYETDQSYEFMVRCVDTGGLEEFAEVTINIQDVNDNSPVCDQPNNISTTLSVGTYNYTSLFALLCTDQDTGANGVLQYEITQIKPNASPFMINIDDATGEVGYQGILETTGVYRYKVTIMVSDTGTIPLSVSVDVLVLIEVIPSCSYTNGLELTLPVGSHNLSSVLNVSCTGNDQLSYSIVQNNLGYFEIDGTTGEVTFSGTPAYDLTIRVSDPSGLYLELDKITVTITSTNQNGTSDQDSSDSTFLILIALLALLLLTTVVLCVVLLAIWLRFRRRYNGVIT